MEKRQQKLTHIEKRPAIQTRPRNLPPPPQILQVLPDAYFSADKLLRKPLVPRTLDIADEFIGKEELDARGEGGVEDEARGGVLCCAACDAVYDCVLSGKSGLQRGERGIVDGFVYDGGGGGGVGGWGGRSVG